MRGVILLLILKIVGVYMVMLNKLDPSNQLSYKGIRYNITYDCITKDNVKGLCKKMSECKSFHNPSPLLLPPPSEICGHLSYDNSLIVCCSDLRDIINAIPSDWHFPDTRKSEKKCSEFIAEKNKIQAIFAEQESSNYYCSDFTCQLPVFIIGGEDAKRDEFPHMALLGWEKADGTGHEFNCGGSLISDRFVLTAAHCLYTDNTIYKANEPNLIRLGDTFPTDIKIESLIRHPDYKPPIKYHDIALVKLSTPAPFYLDIRPACLSLKSKPSGKATTIGWGNINESGSRPARLQKVELDIYDNQTCSESYGVTRTQPSGVHQSQFCAGFRKGGKDACQGDSGGPIHVKDRRDTDTFRIIGIVSYGKGCGSSSGGVYTKVSHYLNWIENNVWP